MPSFISLIQNENMKIYRRMSTWVMIGLLALATIAGALMIKGTHKEEATGDWKKQIIAENQTLKAQLSEGNMPKAYNKQLEKQLRINEYRLEHELKPIASNSFWGFVVESSNLIEFITLFTIVIAAGSVANEFSWGTIKLLLIRPASRSKILLSKYAATILFAVCMLLFLLISSFIVSAVVFGVENVRDPYLAYQDGRVVETSMILHVLSVYGLNSVNLVMMVTFAFMISTVFRNSSFAIGLAIFLMFTGSQITMLLAAKFEWAKYSLFANTNLMQYIDGIPPVEGMTMSFSIMMLLVYFAAFNSLTWLIFKKRDIAA
ncbi:ABC-2 type transport system permease protein [Anoxybacillus calidus]|uniref:ABC-2 type transport system permease protein n=1 Tax=[Anoxybacillus] calidus TaxID=575178 RepID=A0A7W0BTR4_9BACL|nr:ABC transporter permease [Anoxybacillus calidus]MBA2869770.1 ABC-2 type transport system permease protein [Anoxybacillus calidus]